MTVLSMSEYDGNTKVAKPENSKPENEYNVR